MAKNIAHVVESLNNAVLSNPGRAAAQATALPSLNPEAVAYVIIDVKTADDAREVGKAISIATRKGYEVLLRYRAWGNASEYTCCSLNSPIGCVSVAGHMNVLLKAVDAAMPPGGDVKGLILGSDVILDYYNGAKKPVERVVEQLFHNARPYMPPLGPSPTNLIVWMPVLKITAKHVFYRNRAPLFTSLPDIGLLQLAELQQLDDYEDQTYRPPILVELRSEVKDPVKAVCAAVTWLLTSCLSAGVVTFLNLNKTRTLGETLLTSKHYTLISEAVKTVACHEELECPAVEPAELFKLVACDEGKDELFLFLSNHLSGGLVSHNGEFNSPQKEIYTVDLVDLESLGIESAVPPDFTVVVKSHVSIEVAEDLTLSLPPDGFCVLRMFAHRIRLLKA